MIFTDQECLGHAVTLFLQLISTDDDDCEPDDDPIYQYDYNDDELLACGVDRY